MSAACILSFGLTADFGMQQVEQKHKDLVVFITEN